MGGLVRVRFLGFCMHGEAFGDGLFFFFLVRSSRPVRNRCSRSEGGTGGRGFTMRFTMDGGREGFLELGDRKSKAFNVQYV